MINFVSRHWGDLASVVGLVFSVLAFVFSKRASRAAKEARDSIHLRNFGQDIAEAQHMAAEIAQFVISQRSELAILRINDLLVRVNYFAERWDMRLSTNSRATLVRTREQLREMRASLLREPISEMSAEHRDRLMAAAGLVTDMLAQELGTATKAADNKE